MSTFSFEFKQENVETLLFFHQVTLKNHASGEEKILFLNSEQEKDKTLYTDQVLLMLSSEFAH